MRPCLHFNKSVIRCWRSDNWQDGDWGHAGTAAPSMLIVKYQQQTQWKVFASAEQADLAGMVTSSPEGHFLLVIIWKPIGRQKWSSSVNQLGCIITLQHTHTHLPTYPAHRHTHIHTHQQINLSLIAEDGGNDSSSPVIVHVALWKKHVCWWWVSKNQTHAHALSLTHTHTHAKGRQSLDREFEWGRM